MSVQTLQSLPVFTTSSTTSFMPIASRYLTTRYLSKAVIVFVFTASPAADAVLASYPNQSYTCAWTRTTVSVPTSSTRYAPPDGASTLASLPRPSFPPYSYVAHRFVPAMFSPTAGVFTPATPGRHMVAPAMPSQSGRTYFALSPVAASFSVTTRAVTSAYAIGSAVRETRSPSAPSGSTRPFAKMYSQPSGIPSPSVSSLFGLVPISSS